MAFGAAGVIPVVVGASDAPTLQAKMREAQAAQVLASAPAPSQLIDVFLSGGGTGALFQVDMLFSELEDTFFPDLASQIIRVFSASDRATLQAKLVAFYASVPGSRTTFWDAAAAGAGAVFVAVVVYQLS
jgi:hypothetical protein